MEKRGLSGSRMCLGLLLTFLFSFVSVLFLSGNISGLQENMCVNAEVTSVKPVSVDAGEDFTVGVQIDNCGDEIPENVTFKITRHSEDIEIKEPLSIHIGNLGYSNSKRFLTYHMYAKSNASPGIHNFETKVIYGKNNFSIEKEDNFTVTVESEEPDLALSGISTSPEIIKKGDKIILTADIENSGDGEAKDVRVKLNDLGLEGTKNDFLGEIKSDENLPARFILEASESGLHEGNIKITYKKYGEIKEMELPFEVQVFEKDYSLYWIIGIIVIVIIGFFLFKQFYSNSKQN